MPSSIGRPILEVCVDTPDGLATAIEAGADRIELCADLGVGGLTPSPGMIAAARGAPVPVYAMIRPRPGDFVFGPRERAAMLADIAAVRDAGLHGVVLGASRPDRSLDEHTLTVLCEAARGLGRTLHRAFDVAPDLDAALEVAVRLRFDRILTSGGITDAPGGRESLRRLVTQAGGRIAIMAGGGVTPANVVAVLRETGVPEVHASAKVEMSQDADLVRWGFCAPRAFTTSGETIRALKGAIDRSAS